MMYAREIAFVSGCIFILATMLAAYATGFHDAGQKGDNPFSGRLIVLAVCTIMLFGVAAWPN